MPMDNIYDMKVAAAARSTVKLALEGPGNGGPCVRIQLPNEIGQEAIELLRTRALELYQMNRPEQNWKDAKVHLTYRDEENDLCFLFSGDDFQSALSSSTGPLRVLARVELPAVSIPANPTASTQTAHHYSEGSFTDAPAHKVVETLIGLLTAASVALQKHSGSEEPAAADAAEETTAAGNRETAVNADTAETPLVCPFIHGRHTCDGCLTSPIIGKRFHAINLPNYDLCTACKDKYQGNEITFEEAENEHDVEMQERWKRRFSKWAKKSDKHHEKWARKQMRRGGPEHGSGRCGGGRHWNRNRSFNPPPVNPEPAQGQVAEPAQGQVAEPAQGQTEHANREVDPALKEAIRLSVLEVQANNHKEHKAETSASSSHTAETSNKASSSKNDKPVEEQVEEAIQEAENALKKVGPALKQAIRRSVRNVKYSAKKVEEEVLKEVGPALQEAIRWSMQRGGRKPKQPAEEKKAPEPTKPEASQEETVSPVAVAPRDVEPRIVVQVAPPIEDTASPIAQEEEFVIPPEAPIGAYPAPSAPTECEEEKVVTSEESLDEDVKGNDEVATAVASTAEDVAVVNDSISEELKSTSFEDANEKTDVVVVDASEDLKPTATILDGEEDEGSNGWDDSSNNSWGMVNEDGDVLVDDEALANAAQVIGSALFESGISSQPTTSTPIVMFDVESPMMRWSKQLSKLHELGFDDDKVNIEIMERLEAGDIGSDTYEEISVERIVNELMKGW